MGIEVHQGNPEKHWQPKDGPKMDKLVVIPSVLYYCVEVVKIGEIHTLLSRFAGGALIT